MVDGQGDRGAADRCAGVSTSWRARRPRGTVVEPVPPGVRSGVPAGAPLPSGAQSPATTE